MCLEILFCRRFALTDLNVTVPKSANAACLLLTVGLSTIQSAVSREELYVRFCSSQFWVKHAPEVSSAIPICQLRVEALTSIIDAESWSPGEIVMFCMVTAMPGRASYHIL